MGFPQKLFICLLLLQQSLGDIIQPFGRRNTTRVIGGNEANSGQFPFTVLIVADIYQCGGSILNKNTVLTAAHCLYYPESTHLIPKATIIIYAGSVKQNRDAMKRFTVKAMMHHEEFQPGSQSGSNDIAIIRIKREFWSGKPTDPTIQPIELTETGPPEGKICTVSGWGHYDQSQTPSPTLRYAPVQVLSHEECVTRYQRNRITVSEGMTCAASPGVDACLGDSGGPLVCSLNNSNRLVGIVSWGIECADKYFPGVYTDVAHYREWISDLAEKIEDKVMGINRGENEEDYSDSSFLTMTPNFLLIIVGFLISIAGLLRPISYINLF